MYSTRGISHNSFSIGRVARSSTSLALKPGIETSTSIIGTLIWGSHAEDRGAVAHPLLGFVGEGRGQSEGALQHPREEAPVEPQGDQREREEPARGLLLPIGEARPGAGAPSQLREERVLQRPD